MSIYDAVLGARVLAEGRAIRKTTVRHYHISDDAMLLSILRFGGERFRPVVFQFSRLGEEIDTDSDLVVVTRYTDMEHLLEETQRFAAKFRVAFEEGRQIIVPNRATIEAMGHAGRALAFRSRSKSYGLTKGQHDHLTLAGRYMLELHRYSRRPGQALILPLAESVAEHWATLTAPFERADLATLDAQINPQAVDEGDDVFSAAMKARSLPQSVGPNMQPRFEETVLRRYERMRAWARENGASGLDYSDETESVLRGLRRDYAKQTIWAHTLMRRVLERELSELQESRSSAERWAEDAEAARKIIRRAGDPDSPYWARQLPTQAAEELGKLESLNSVYQIRKLLDDPMMVLPALADGSAVAGQVLDVTGPDHIGRGKYKATFTVLSDEPTFLDTDESKLIWGYGKGHVGWIIKEIADDDRTITLTATFGRNYLAVPETGQRIYLVPDPGDPFYLKVPGKTPWTHGGDAPPPPTEDVMHDNPPDDVANPYDDTLETAQEDDDSLDIEKEFEDD